MSGGGCTKETGTPSLPQETCSPIVAGGSRNVCIDFLDMINQHKSMHNIS